MKHSLSTTLMPCLSIWAMALISAPLAAGYVDLAVTGSGTATALEILDSDVKCGNDKNCIQTTEGQELDLDFKLEQACKVDGPAYRLSGMQLSMIQRQPDSANPATMIKAFGYYILPAIVMSDFDADGKGNIVWDNMAGNNNKLHDDKIKIKDRNRGEYDVFYQISAEKCDPAAAGPAVIHLDPRVKNTGQP